MTPTNTPDHVINWQEALEILQDCDAKGVPKPFSITFSTGDESAGTGGEIITYERAVWHVKGGRLKPYADREATPPTDRVTKGKNPHHGQHWTRNIRGIESNQIRKLHIHLILLINGMSVR